jgi:ADP-heptose:LPS heptosyltransferase
MVAITDRDHGKTVEAIKRSLQLIQPARTILFSNVHINSPDFDCIVIGLLGSARKYNEWVTWHLGKQPIATSHILLIQYDGYVIDAGVWTNEFLEYDYIGAPWRYTDGRNVGNGGFSLRSMRLHKALASDPAINIGSPEDEIICRLFRHYLEENHAIKFAPEDLAHRFSYEMHPPLCKTFGTHNSHFKPYREPIILKRTGAMGDVIMLEPIMEHFYNQGYRIILDCIPTYLHLFYNHNFPVEHIANCPGEDFTECRQINFDMGYEITPQVPVIEAYFKLAGATDYTVRNAQLNFHIEGTRKIMNKYVVVHIDETDMPYRNVYGIDWHHVRLVLNTFGYEVLQVGRNPKVNAGIRINTNNESMLAWVIAGADLFIGVDSGPGQIAMACGVKCLMFFGSVNPALRYLDRSNLTVLQNDCKFAGCYHSVIGVRGVDCVIHPTRPPCTEHTSNDVVQKVKEILKSPTL